MGTPTGQIRSKNPAAMVQKHPGLERFFQLGWFAKGVVYVLAGVLAVAAWLHVRDGDGQSGGEASPTGALESLATATGGRILLVVVAGGLFLYAAWRVLSAMMPGENDVDGVVHRIGYLVSAILYCSFGITAVSLARNSQSVHTTDGNSKVTSITAEVMGHTSGRWAIGIAGLITLGAAVYRAVKGARRDVTDEMRLPASGEVHRHTIKILGSIGEIGRGIALGLIGIFLVRAAWNYDPNEATGLDGALRRALTHSGGGAVVVVTGTGFVAYGLFCLITFRYRHLERV
jgi:hypothetical protein